jgi:tRNA(adenine34) deaminase
MDTTDTAMMARCVELSRIALGKGEYPFGTVIARNGRIVAEAVNRANRDGDVSRHAEIIALSQAQKSVGRDALRHHTLYTNVEPCAMCAYSIREAGLGRVVYALESPVMGGLSRWNILRDDGMSDRMPQIFGTVPEIVGGVLSREATQVWRDWNPLAWEMIKLRGLLAEPSMADEAPIHVHPARGPSLWQAVQILVSRRTAPRLATIDAPAVDQNLL